MVTSTRAFRFAITFWICFIFAKNLELLRSKKSRSDFICVAIRHIFHSRWQANTVIFITGQIC